MNIPEILPCPFCGKQPMKHHAIPNIVCCVDHECGGYVRWWSLELWNRRQPTPEAAQEDAVPVVTLAEIREIFAAAHPPKPEPTVPPEAMRTILWMAFNWNDHNSKVSELLSACREVAKRIGVHNYDEANEWLASNSAVAAPKPPAEWMAEAAKHILHSVVDCRANPKDVAAIVAIIAQHAPKVPEGWQERADALLASYSRMIATAKGYSAPSSVTDKITLEHGSIALDILTVMVSAAAPKAGA